MVTVPGWAVGTSALAPVALIGGWTLAERADPTFDPVRETISALAASTAERPGVMTVALLVTGLCHVGTALGLRTAPRATRLLLATGGLGTAAVAAFPVDAAPLAHGLAAAVAFGALTAWSAVGLGRTGRVGAAVLAALLVWFVVELQSGSSSDLTGLSERLLAGAQALWPLVVVLLARRTATDRGP